MSESKPKKRSSRPQKSKLKSVIGDVGKSRVQGRPKDQEGESVRGDSVHTGNSCTFYCMHSRFTNGGRFFGGEGSEGFNLGSPRPVPYRIDTPDRVCVVGFPQHVSFTKGRPHVLLDERSLDIEDIKLLNIKSSCVKKGKSEKIPGSHNNMVYLSGAWRVLEAVAQSHNIPTSLSNFSEFATLHKSLRVETPSRDNKDEEKSLPAEPPHVREADDSPDPGDAPVPEEEQPEAEPAPPIAEGKREVSGKLTKPPGGIPNEESIRAAIAVLGGVDLTKFLMEDSS
jgi:hypothetical protein